jgi:hypothetical protein
MLGHRPDVIRMTCEWRTRRAPVIHAHHARVGKDWAKGLTKETHDGIRRNAEARRGMRYERRTPVHLDRRRRRFLRTGALVWSGQLAYAIGLIATDGCLYNTGRHIAFTSKDPDLIETFMSCVGHLARPRIIVGPGGSRALQVELSDVELYEWLLRAGVMPRKSHSLGELRVPDEFFLSLVRGLLDGDGSISNFWHAPTKRTYPDYRYERLVVTFTSASRRHLEWLQEQLQRRLQLKGWLVRQPPRANRLDVFVLGYGKRASIRLLTAIYADPAAPKLQRKWNVWNDYRERNLCRRRDSNPHGLSATRP